MRSRVDSWWATELGEVSPTASPISRRLGGGRTLEETGGVFHDRFLDLVAVKGKKEPVEVYEILGLSGA